MSSSSHRRNRGFTDEEILDPDFPDVRLSIKDHRIARHRYYRNKIFEQKRKTAIILYKDGWVGILFNLLQMYL